MKFLLAIVSFLFLSLSSSAQSVELKDLPENAQEHITSKYKKYKINKIEYKEDHNFPYTVELQKKNKGYYLYFNKVGMLMDREKFKSYSFDGPETKPDRSGAESSPIPTM